jgi:hypothetical protein
VPCATACISPLHTHDITGIIHTESSTKKNNTLGQLMTEWNLKFNNDCFATHCLPHEAVAVFVNGIKSHANFRSIPLTDHTEIAIIVGEPPPHIPTAADWSHI